MKFLSASTSLLLARLLVSPEALAFLPPSSSSSQRQTATTTTTTTTTTTRIMPALQETKNPTTTAAAAASIVLGIGLSAQAAFANNDAIALLRQQPSVLSSSTVVLAEIEKFALPSYESSKGSVLIDISGDLETVNKKTMAQAKQRREKTDTSAEKLQADELRRAEKDGSSLLDSLLGESDADRRARIEAEKAETRANRWNTF